ncbi:MAG: hypothetical protein ACP5UM_07015 [Anaerolineae bacterium]
MRQTGWSGGLQTLSRGERRLVGALLVAAAGLRLAMAWLPVATLIEKTLPDDAFYYFSIARNLALGRGSSVDGVTPTNGFHPLWAVLLVPAFRWVPGPDLPIHLALTLAALLDTATGWLLFRTVRRAGGGFLGAILASFLYLFHPAVLLQAANGLETALAVFLWAGFFCAYLAVRGRTPLALWFGLGLLGGTAVLARTDSAFLPAFVALDLAWRKRRQAAAALGALALGALIPLTPWIVWNQTTMGTWLQSSGVAIPYIYHEHFRRAVASGTPLLVALWGTLGAAVASGFVAFWQVAGVGAIGWAAAWGATFFYRSRLSRGEGRAVLDTARPFWVPVAAALALLAFHVLWRWYPRAWYFVPLAYAAALTAGPALEEAGHQLRALGERWRRFVPSVVTLLALLMGLQWSRNWPVGLYPWQADFRFAADWAAAALPEGAPIGAFNAGIQGFYGTHTVVNLDGVVDVQAHEAIRKGTLYAYALHRGVRYVIDHRTYVEGMYAPFWGEPLERTLLPVHVLGAEHPLYGPLTVYRLLPSGAAGP